jgi:aryl-alcohol dehydrogenase-like predicted oxidoreductase
LTLEYHSDPARGSAAINAALDAGITVLDTAAAYTTAGGSHVNEQLIQQVLSTRGADSAPVLVSTKGGHYRAGETFPIDGRSATLRRHCDESLQALGVEQIGLYFLHWPDPVVPIEESVGALEELRREGKIRHIGVSNVGLPELAAARTTAPIAAVQNHFSLFDQSSADVLDACDRVGIAFLAYSPLRGFAQAPDVLEAELSAIGEAHGVHPARVALAWLLFRSPVLIPVSGATRAQTARDAAAAGTLNLSDEEFAQLDAASKRAY